MIDVATLGLDEAAELYTALQQRFNKASIGEFVPMLESKFEKSMERKTGWGRNEVKEVFQKAIKETYEELIK